MIRARARRPSGRAATRLRVADGLAALGTRGRTVATWVDLARSTGAGHAVRRLRDARRLGALGDDARNAVYRRIWAEAARALGADLHDLGGGFYLLERDGRATRVYQQVTALDDPVTLRLALDKPVVHRLLTEAGVPVPAYLEFDFRRLEPAVDFLDRTDASCVVKPARGTGGGAGVTAGVRTVGELLRARLLASRFDTRVLIERQGDGPVHRLLFLDGELLDVVRHLPPRVTGDGRTTVEGLVAAENARRLKARGTAGLSLLEIDLDTVLTLARANLGLSSVLPSGHTVALKAVTNDNRLEDRERYLDRLAPELVDVARRAAGALGLRLAGVDVITTDPRRPLGDTAGVVTDVNGTPGIHHHYLVADTSEAAAVAVPILGRLLDEAVGEPSASPRP